MGFVVDDFHCSFCGKRRREVRKLISGPRVFICDECTVIAAGIIRDHPAVDAKSAAAEPERAPSSNEKLSCSFCGKSQAEVAHLVAGPSVNICDECVGLCQDIIAEETAKGPGICSLCKASGGARWSARSDAAICSACGKRLAARLAEMKESGDQASAAAGACAFCGKDREDGVEHLLLDHGLLVCDRCVGLADLLAQVDAAVREDERVIRRRPKPK